MSFTKNTVSSSSSLKSLSSGSSRYPRGTIGLNDSQSTSQERRRCVPIPFWDDAWSLEWPQRSDSRHLVFVSLCYEMLS